ncbi:MAG: transporter substrate-binding domain-containing protein [Bermanella sp.]
MAKYLWLLVLSLSAFFPIESQAYGQDKQVYMTSLEWPPYSGEKLSRQGVTVATTKAIFKAMGYELVVDFYPWSQAVKLGLDKNSKYLGYFPEYYSSELDKTCNFSETVGSGPLGFAQLKSKPVNWTSLDDIAKLSRVGVVQDYVNSAEFDKRVREGNIKTEAVTSDLENLKKLAANRVPIIVIDKYVLEYLLENSLELQEYKNKIEFNEKLLEDKYLYLCFKNTPQSKTIKKAFDKGAHRVDMKSFFNESLR